MGVIKIEGKSVTLDDKIIKAGIPAIKAALSVDFPDVENADIEIVGAPGVAMSATVVKRGTGKGARAPLPNISSAVDTVAGGRGRNRYGVYIKGLKTLRPDLGDVKLEIVLVCDPVDKKWRSGYHIDTYSLPAMKGGAGHSPSAKSTPHPTEAEAIREQVTVAREYLVEIGKRYGKPAAVKKFIVRLDAWTEKRCV